MAGLSLLAAVVVMTVTAVVAARAGRVSVVDAAWGIALLLVALVCAAYSSTWQSWLLVALVGVWAGRLSSHIFTRSRGHGEDPRYEVVLGPLPSAGIGVALRRVFLVQGVAVWLVSLPLQAAEGVSAAVGRLRRSTGRWGRRGPVTPDHGDHPFRNSATPAARSPRPDYSEPDSRLRFFFSSYALR